MEKKCKKCGVPLNPKGKAEKFLCAVTRTHESKKKPGYCTNCEKD